VQETGHTKEHQRFVRTQSDVDYLALLRAGQCFNLRKHNKSQLPRKENATRKSHLKNADKASFPEETHPPSVHFLECEVIPFELVSQVAKIRKMKQDVYIPRMKSSSTKSTGDNLSSRSRVPHFRYAGGPGNKRNLPGHPEFIRLLYSPSNSAGGETGSANMELWRENTLLSLYGGDAESSRENIDPNRKRRRRIVCKYCRKPPGHHQKWCIYIDTDRDNDDKGLRLSRSYTDDNIHLPKRKTKKVTTPAISRSQSSLDKYPVNPNLPDYSTLHRDVYIRALADSRARLVKKNRHDFSNQTTRPWVFSYYSSMNKPENATSSESEAKDGMEEIFGKKHTDFTKYYEICVKVSHPKIDLD